MGIICRNLLSKLYYIFFPFTDYKTCFSDVVTIEKTAENFRLIYDVKGRFTVHEITPEEAKVCTSKSELRINVDMSFSVMYFKSCSF